MKNVFKIALCQSMVCCCISVATSQSNWKMQSAQLSTKWNKQIDTENVLSEYPRPQMVRKNWVNLNGLWEYAIAKKSFDQPTKFDGQILVPYPFESALSGTKKLLLPDELLWYKKTFQAPSRKGKKVLLHFGAVDWQSTISINGKYIGSHNGGYQNFSFDISEELQEGDNELIVKVSDPSEKGFGPYGKQNLNPQGIMYTACSGIWQTVWLEVVPEVFIESLKVTPDVDNNRLQLSVNAFEFTKDYSIETLVNNEKLRFTQAQKIEIPINNTHLWSPEDPFLYDITVRLLYNGKPVDEVKSYFGMRKIEIKKDANGIDRIFLNNKYIFNLGVLDQGYWPDGIYTAPTDEALRWDIQAIKSMGFNTIRKHIKVEPDRWYYWCDKLGMLVWQDMPFCANGSQEAKFEYEKENKANIEQLYNHPSIICWVLFNEGWNSYDQKRLTETIKKLDLTRLVNGHSGENYAKTPAAEKWISSDMTDVHEYPGPGIAPKQDGKAMVLGEWGGVGVSIAGHQWNAKSGWGYIKVSPEEFARKYEFMMKHLKIFEEEGLSGAIYTQPFDVEIEENGLITYDREIFKIPAEKIRAINQTMFHE